MLWTMKSWRTRRLEARIGVFSLSASMGVPLDGETAVIRQAVAMIAKLEQQIKRMDPVEARPADTRGRRRRCQGRRGPAPRTLCLPDPSWLAWNDGAIRKIAQTIYDARAFDRLPLLADALEDAGCTDAAILSHCREPGEHVRGCWVVDLLLGKN